MLARREAKSAPVVGATASAVFGAVLTPSEPSGLTNCFQSTLARLVRSWATRASRLAFAVWETSSCCCCRRLMRLESVASPRCGLTSTFCATGAPKSGMLVSACRHATDFHGGIEGIGVTKFRIDARLRIARERTTAATLEHGRKRHRGAAERIRGTHDAAPAGSARGRLCLGNAGAE